MTSNSHFVCPPITPATDTATPAEDFSNALTGASLGRWCYENPNLAALTIEGLRAATPAVGGEPVAWRWRPPGATLWIYDPTDEWRLAQGDDIETEPLYAALPASPLRGRDDALEEAAQYHDRNAADCRAIALVNLDNDLGADSKTHAVDHEIAAEDIRAMKGSPPEQPAPPLRGREPFEAFVKRAGFTDWSRYGDGYAKPLIDRMWSAWSPPEQPAADPEFKWGLDYGKDLLKDINQLAHTAGTDAIRRDVLQRAYREIKRLTAFSTSPPEQPAVRCQEPSDDEKIDRAEEVLSKSDGETK